MSDRGAVTQHAGVIVPALQGPQRSRTISAARHALICQAVLERGLCTADVARVLRIRGAAVSQHVHQAAET